MLKAENNINLAEGTGISNKQRWRREKCIGPSIFIMKAYEILQNEINTSIINWNEEGTNFIIKDVEQFQQQILPLYFRHRNFSSFVRQLNMYDFHKVRNQNNKNIFEHKQFKRNNKDLLKKIKRKGCTTIKKTQINHEDISNSLDEEEFQQSNNEIEQPITEEKIRSTMESIPIISLRFSPYHHIKYNHKKTTISTYNPQKNLLIDEFINNIPTQIFNDKQIQNLVCKIKKQQKYECLNNRQDLQRIFRILLSRNRLLSNNENQLDDLSIEQQIMVDNIQGYSINTPTLAIFSTEKFIPSNSIAFISSMYLDDDINQLIYPRYHQ